MNTGGEFDLIARIRARAGRHAGVPLGIGDDCAALSSPSDGSQLLVTTDMLLDGRHFVLADAGPRAVGYKAMAVNLSDIAAMAGEPIAAFVSVALPLDAPEPAAIAEGLLDGLLECAGPFGVPLAGGDTNAWHGPLALNVALIGRAARPVTRSGAQPGDILFITGPLGGSLLGRHLHPTPRVREARALASAVDLHAMIDLSDGLASDLSHILEESRVGAILDAASIPIHPDAHTLAIQSGRSPLDLALNDGEDFELLFTVTPTEANLLDRSPPCTVHRVGTITADPGLSLRRGDILEPLTPRGFDHLREPSHVRSPSRHRLP